MKGAGGGYKGETPAVSLSPQGEMPDEDNQAYKLQLSVLSTRTIKRHYTDDNITHGIHYSPSTSSSALLPSSFTTEDGENGHQLPPPLIAGYGALL